MERFDKQIQKSLELSVEDISFERHQEVRDAVLKEASPGKLHRFFHAPAAPVLASAAALLVVSVLALGILLWVPGDRPEALQEPVIVAGEMPFSAVQHLVLR